MGHGQVIMAGGRGEEGVLGQRTLEVRRKKWGSAARSKWAETTSGADQEQESYTVSLCGEGGVACVGNVR